jgi:hypothetical protein
MYPAGQPLSDIVATNQTCTREQLWGTAGFALCLAADASSQHVCQQRVYSAGLYVAGTALIGLALIAAIIALGLGAARAAAATEIDPHAAAYAQVPPHGNGGGEKDAEHAAPPSPGLSVEASTTWRNFTLAFGVLLAILAALCLFVAHYLAFNALVEDQAPSGDVGLSNPLKGNFPIQSPWYLTTTGVVYASLAWLMAGIGVIVACLGSCLGGL